MSIKKLEAFIRIVDTGSFSEAAERLGFTQSAISRQIQSLEEDLGVLLLHRHGSLVEPTPAGRSVYRRAERLVAEWEELRRECRALANGPGGVLRVGASSVPSTTLLPQLLKQLRTVGERLEFTVITGDSVSILALLEQHAIDAAIIGTEPPSNQYRSLPVADDELVVIGTVPIPELNAIEDLPNFPLIVRERGSGTREALERKLHEHGLDLRRLQVAAEVGGTDAAIALVRAGLGLSVISRWSLPEHREDQGICALLRIPTDRRFYAVCHRRREDEPLLRLWLEEAGKLPFSFT